MIYWRWWRPAGQCNLSTKKPICCQIRQLFQHKFGRQDTQNKFNNTQEITQKVKYKKRLRRVWHMFTEFHLKLKRQTNPYAIIHFEDFFKLCLVSHIVCLVPSPHLNWNKKIIAWSQIARIKRQFLQSCWR